MFLQAAANPVKVQTQSFYSSQKNPKLDSAAAVQRFVPESLSVN